MGGFILATYLLYGGLNRIILRYLFFAIFCDLEIAYIYIYTGNVFRTRSTGVLWIRLVVISCVTKVSLRLVIISCVTSFFPVYLMSFAYPHSSTFCLELKSRRHMYAYVPILKHARVVTAFVYGTR